MRAQREFIFVFLVEELSRLYCRPCFQCTSLSPSSSQYAFPPYSLNLTISCSMLSSRVCFSRALCAHSFPRFRWRACFTGQPCRRHASPRAWCRSCREPGCGGRGSRTCLRRSEKNPSPLPLIPGNSSRKTAEKGKMLPSYQYQLAMTKPAPIV